MGGQRIRNRSLECSPLGEPCKKFQVKLKGVLKKLHSGEGCLCTSVRMLVHIRMDVRMHSYEHTHGRTFIRIMSIYLTFAIAHQPETNNLAAVLL